MLFRSVRELPVDSWRSRNSLSRLTARTGDRSQNLEEVAGKGRTIRGGAIRLDLSGVGQGRTVDKAGRNEGVLKFLRSRVLVNCSELTRGSTPAHLRSRGGQRRSRRPADRTQFFELNVYVRARTRR